jgi:uncharacterized DUF497 family protein
MLVLKEPIRFEWDEGNKEKNLIKHQVTNAECEEVFSDPHKRVIAAKPQGVAEERYLLIGRSQKGRALFVVFTLRRDAVRVISARDLNKKEQALYEKALDHS